jgi:hypothetical protein
MVTRIFWILFGVESAVFAGMILWTFFGSKHWGPEGPVGAWLIFVVPPLMLGVPLALFVFGKSDHARLVALAILALPLLQVVIGPIYSRIQDYQTTRRVEGDAIFTKPAERQLAHAFRAHDAELVKKLIPQAGDLNAGHRGEDSLFRFCMTNLGQSEASLEIVKAMLAAGADAKSEMAAGTFPLFWAIGWGPAMTELLVNAGADPNSRDHARPLWWEAIEGGYPEHKIQSLEILLNHGADLSLRDSENGPVAFAVHRKNWRAAWMLIQRGAAWKDEKAFSTPVVELVAFELRYTSSSGKRPEELLKIAKLYELDVDAY